MIYNPQLSISNQKVRDLEGTLAEIKNKLFVEKKITSTIPKQNFKIKTYEDEIERLKKLLADTMDCYKSLHVEYERADHDLGHMLEVKNQLNERNVEFRNLKASMKILQTDYDFANQIAMHILTQNNPDSEEEYHKHDLHIKFSHVNAILDNLRRKANSMPSQQEKLRHGNDEILMLTGTISEKEASEANLIKKQQLAQREASLVSTLTEKIGSLQTTEKLNDKIIDDQKDKIEMCEAMLKRMSQLEDQLSLTESAQNKVNLLNDNLEVSKNDLTHQLSNTNKKQEVVPSLRSKIITYTEELEEKNDQIHCYKIDIQELKEKELPKIPMLENLVATLRDELKEKIWNIKLNEKTNQDLIIQKTHLSNELKQIPILEGVLTQLKEKVVNQGIDINETNKEKAMVREEKLAQDGNLNLLSEKLRLKEEVLQKTSELKEQLKEQNEQNNNDINAYKIRVADNERHLEMIPNLEAQAVNLTKEIHKIKQERDEQYVELVKGHKLLTQTQNDKSAALDDKRNTQHLNDVLRKQINEQESLIKRLIKVENEYGDLKVIHNSLQLTFDKSIQDTRIQLQKDEKQNLELLQQRKNLEITKIDNNEEARNMEQNFNENYERQDQFLHQLECKYRTLDSAKTHVESAKNSMMEDNQKLRVRISELDSMVTRSNKFEELYKQSSHEKMFLESKLNDIAKDLGEAQSHYEITSSKYNNFMEDYNRLREKNEMLAALNDDRQKRIEKKAVTIDKLQMRLVCCLTELERVTKNNDSGTTVTIKNDEIVIPRGYNLCL